MTAHVFVNADRSKVVDEGSPEAAFKLHAKDARKLGLISDKDEKAAEAAETAPEPAVEADTEQAMVDRTITRKSPKKA